MWRVHSVKEYAPYECWTPKKKMKGRKLKVAQHTLLNMCIQFKENESVTNVFGAEKLLSQFDSQGEWLPASIFGVPLLTFSFRNGTIFIVSFNVRCLLSSRCKLSALAATGHYVFFPKHRSRKSNEFCVISPWWQLFLFPLLPYRGVKTIFVSFL